MGLLFEWDEEKNKKNIVKHGIGFDEASSVFNDGLAEIIDDPDHSEYEQRYLILGMSKKIRPLVVAFTERNNHIRIISSRLATKNERRHYEEKRRN